MTDHADARERATTRAQRLVALRGLLDAPGAVWPSMEALIEALAEAGITTGLNLTSVSKDLRALGAVRVPIDGVTSWALPDYPADMSRSAEPFGPVLRGVIGNVSVSTDQVVVTTLAGGAPLVAAQIDRARHDSVMGTIAGHDTVLVIAHPFEGEEVAQWIRDEAQLPA